MAKTTWTGGRKRLSGRTRSEASAVCEVTSFGGTDRRAVTGTKESREVCNFRIGEDGALRKRCGYRYLARLDGAVRKLWNGVVDGREVLFAVTGTQVWRFFVGEGEMQAVGALGTAEGDVDLFWYEGMLYLLDGAALYWYVDGTFREASCYVPQYGKLWNPMTAGEIYEDRSLATRRVRISYQLPGTRLSAVYLGGLVAESVEYAEVRGVRYTEDVELSEDRMWVSFSWPERVEEVSIGITLPAVEGPLLTDCRRALALGEAAERRIFAYGCEPADRMLCSQPVSAKSQAASLAGYPDALSPLYFPARGRVVVGDEGFPIRAICRRHTRGFVFTTGSTWVMEQADWKEDGTPVLLPLHDSFGAGQADGVVLCDNDLMTVSEGSVWRWSTANTVYDAESAERISAPVEAGWSENFCENARIFCHRDGGELWISDPADEDGRVWIYAYRQKVWYAFDGIGAQGYFAWGGQVGFLRDGELFVFDEACVRDDEGRRNGEIVGIWRGPFWDFGSAERVKRLGSCLLRGDFSDGSVRLEVESERGLGAVLLFSPEAGQAGEAPCVACGRLNPGQFRYLRAMLTAGGEERTVLSALTLTAR